MESFFKSKSFFTKLKGAIKKFIGSYIKYKVLEFIFA